MAKDRSKSRNIVSHHNHTTIIKNIRWLSLQMYGYSVFLIAVVGKAFYWGMKFFFVVCLSGGI